MRSVNACAVIRVQELGHDVFAEHVTRASLRESETLHVGLGVRPHQVCKGTLVRDFLDSRDLSVYV